MCGHTPGKVAGRQETVKAEMNGLTPGLDKTGETVNGGAESAVHLDR